MVLVHRGKNWSDSNLVTKDSDPDSAEKLKEAAKTLKAEVSKHKHKRESRSLFATRRFLFPLGILLGALLAFSLIEPRDIQDLHAHLTLLLGEYTMPDIPGFDLSRVENEWQRLRSNIPEVWKFNVDGREFQVGESMRNRGLTAEHPIVLIPGIISTASRYSRFIIPVELLPGSRLWGGFNMLSQVTFNREKWINAMMLDPVTGLDPPGSKIRAAEGIDAASSFIQGYWIWSKIVENLAVVNYDTNNLHMAPYDWRLSFYNLEERDGYFSRLKSTIEGFKRRQNRKVVLAAHSMGANVCCFVFVCLIIPPQQNLTSDSFKWVESPEHGAGGADWVENHIEAYISIAGTHLGVAKAMSAFLSGEMKDTVQMNPAGAYVLERFFSRAERQKLFRSWAGSASMWIKGGNDIWGGPHGAPDDSHNCTHSHGELIAFRLAPPPPPPGSVSTSAGIREELQNMTADTASDWILQHTPSTFQKMIETNFSFGIERDEARLKANNLDHRKWTNPLEVQLPNAPSMKIYCVYGHGKETERSYWYTQDPNAYDETADQASGLDPLCVDPSDGSCSAGTPFDTPLVRKSYIDADFTNETLLPKVVNGVKMGEGDGTVSLLSLGAMCVEGWRRPRWNPANINVTVVELPHRPVPSIPRGGANTSDHVDILGSTGLNEIVLKVVTGVGHEVHDSYVSNIREYAQRMHWD
ncbi:Phospholipid:diacylglycerol acyltransferase [Mycena indigotica]|uniref:Phospholipid:diacylglycerol acyltransferase n=1 Tax=Mycena indigotica TaxID=2126181 RepID=A0A8H6TEC7_9AGAR|nr:Phospholipid:diacylglycerol acyltransferase [Mycena indigotica]KAF7315202.1 Phospholipid:diacylglycerol acyltransferase [Mycena indigotica]